MASTPSLPHLQFRLFKVKSASTLISYHFHWLSARDTTTNLATSRPQSLGMKIKDYNSISTQVNNALGNKPIFIQLKGLECMKGSQAEARVVYAPVLEVGGEGRLAGACKVIIDAFVKSGLALQNDVRQELKFHATVMNVRFRKSKKPKDSFDARNIFKQYGKEEWGEYLVPEVHLSEKLKFDESGYYHCCSSIPLPADLEAE